MSMETFAILKDSSLAEMSTCQICGNIYSNLAKVIQSVDKEKGRIKKKLILRHLWIRRFMTPNKD